MDEQMVMREFEARRENLQSLFVKLAELSGESTEHDLVMQTLEPMDKGRKCFRLVNDVLVERTVGEILPAVAAHKQQIDTVLDMLKKQIDERRKDLAAFQEKYKIRARTEQDDEEDDRAASAQQGVLVSKP